jgi:transposase
MARPPTKSNAVREALIANPDKPATEIAKQFKVSPNLVYAVKAEMKKNGMPKAKPTRKPGPKPGRKPGPQAKPPTAAPEAAHAALDSAFEFVTKVGGLLHAEQLLAKLREIKERL